MSDAAKPQTKNIYQRMIEVQKAVATVEKNETVKMGENDRGYKAVTHDDVAAALHLPLANAGIHMMPDVVEYKASEFEITKKNNYGEYKQRWFRTDLEILVKWVNVDDPADFITSRGFAFALDTSDKSFAKAYSLALKIVLLKNHLLESRDGEEKREFEAENEQDGKKATAKNSAPKQNSQRPAVNPSKPPPVSPPPKKPEDEVQAQPNYENESQDALTPIKQLESLYKHYKLSPKDLSEAIKRAAGVEKAPGDLTPVELDATIAYIKMKTK